MNSLRLRLIALTTAMGLCLAACSRDAADPETPTAPAPSQREITELDAAAAADSFSENLGTDLDIQEFSADASSALVRRLPANSGVEIVYVFRGQGGRAALEPLMFQLGEKLPVSDDEECWMPWDSLLDSQPADPGPCMGAYRAPNFQLTLWIDRHARDLFISYRSPPPELTAPITPPADDDSDQQRNKQIGGVVQPCYHHLPTPPQRF